MQVQNACLSMGETKRDLLFKLKLLKQKVSWMYQTRGCKASPSFTDTINDQGMSNGHTPSLVVSNSEARESIVALSALARAPFTSLMISATVKR